MELAALVMSSIALLVSIISAKYTHTQAKAATRQAAAQELATSIEQDRRQDEVAAAEATRVAALTADVMVKLERVTPVHALSGDVIFRGLLAVINRGPSDCSDVQVDFDSANDGKPVPKLTPPGLPIALIPTGEMRLTGADFTNQTSHDSQVTLSWTDGRGRQSKPVRLVLE